MAAKDEGAYLIDSKGAESSVLSTKEPRLVFAPVDSVMTTEHWQETRVSVPRDYPQWGVNGFAVTKRKARQRKCRLKFATLWGRSYTATLLQPLLLLGITRKATVLANGDGFDHLCPTTRKGTALESCYTR